MLLKLKFVLAILFPITLSFTSVHTLSPSPSSKPIPLPLRSLSLELPKSHLLKLNDLNNGNNANEISPLGTGNAIVMQRVCAWDLFRLRYRLLNLPFVHVNINVNEDNDNDNEPENYIYEGEQILITRSTTATDANAIDVNNGKVVKSFTLSHPNRLLYPPTTTDGDDVKFEYFEITKVIPRKPSTLIKCALPATTNTAIHTSDSESDPESDLESDPQTLQNKPTKPKPCIVEIKTINLNDNPSYNPDTPNSYSHVLTVTFELPTNEVRIGSVSEFLMNFNVFPILDVGVDDIDSDSDIGSVTWVNNATLEVLVRNQFVSSGYDGSLRIDFNRDHQKYDDDNEDDEDDDIFAIDSTSNTETEVVKYWNSSGIINLRISDVGVYAVNFNDHNYHNDHLNNIVEREGDSDSLIVNVISCDDDDDDIYETNQSPSPSHSHSRTVLIQPPPNNELTLTTNKNKNENKNDKHRKQPIFKSKGTSTISMNGNNQFNVAIPIRSGSDSDSDSCFTLGLWIYLIKPKPKPVASDVSDDYDNDNDNHGDNDNGSNEVFKPLFNSNDVSVETSNTQIRMRLKSLTNTTSSSSSSTSGTIPSDTWTHVTFVSTNSNTKALRKVGLYVNSVQVLMLTSTPSISITINDNNNGKEVVSSYNDNLGIGGRGSPVMILTNVCVYEYPFSKADVVDVYERFRGGSVFHDYGRIYRSSSSSSSKDANSASTNNDAILASNLLKEATALLNTDCTDVSTRLDFYKDSTSTSTNTNPSLQTARTTNLRLSELYIYGIELSHVSNMECERLHDSVRSVEKGVYYLEKAVEGGCREAMYRLSLLVLSGVGGSFLRRRQENLVGESFDSFYGSLASDGNPSQSQSIDIDIDSSSEEKEREMTLSNDQGQDQDQEQEQDQVIMLPPPAAAASKRPRTHTRTQEQLNEYALTLLHLSSSLNHAPSNLALGFKYMHGFNGLLVDPDVAAHYLALSADAAHSYYHTPGNQPSHDSTRLVRGREYSVGRAQMGEGDSELQFTILLASQGSVPAINSIATFYYWGSRGFIRDHSRALELWEEAAGMGSVEGMCGAASMYVRGEGTEVDVEKAVGLYERAAELGSAQAYNGLGYAYFLGQGGLPTNHEKAFTYFTSAASLSQDEDSLINAAHCHASGLGTERNVGEAVRLWKRSRLLFESFTGAVELGRRYHAGNGVARSTRKAAVYLLDAGRVGKSGELVRRGFDLYLNGMYSEAFMVYSEAAELGYEVGANNAAYLIDEGYVTFNFDGVVAVNEKNENENDSHSCKDKSNAEICDDTSTSTTDDEEDDDDNSKTIQPKPTSNTNTNINTANIITNNQITLRYHHLSTLTSPNPSHSQTQIGLHHYAFTPPNYKLAMRWFKRAAANGGVKGGFYVGLVYESLGEYGRAGRAFGRVLRIIESRASSSSSSSDDDEDETVPVWVVKLSIVRCRVKEYWLYRRVVEYLYFDANTSNINDDASKEYNYEYIQTITSIYTQAKNTIHKHIKQTFTVDRGRIFGRVGFVDLGIDIVWSNIVLGGLTMGLCLVCVWRLRGVRGG